MTGSLGRIILVLLALLAYQTLLHASILEDTVETWHLFLIFAPLLLMASWLIFRAIAKSLWPVAGLLLATLIYYIVNGAHGRVGLLAVNGLAHAAFNLFPLWLFLRSLQRGREPLITQIARHIKGQLPPKITHYTRQVTVAWCIFFVLQVTISLSLYLFAPVTVWSLFINILDLPLLALMFIAENIYRTLRFPDHPRTPIAQVVAVYTKNYSAPKKTESQP